MTHFDEPICNANSKKEQVSAIERKETQNCEKELRNKTSAGV